VVASRHFVGFHYVHRFANPTMTFHRVGHSNTRFSTQCSLAVFNTENVHARCMQLLLFSLSYTHSSKPLYSCSIGHRPLLVRLFDAVHVIEGSSVDIILGTRPAKNQMHGYQGVNKKIGYRMFMDKGLATLPRIFSRVTLWCVGQTQRTEGS
jgi:hypothetical protein